MNAMKVLAFSVWLWLTASGVAEPTRVLVIVGPSSHPPGSHEVAAGGRLIKHCLESMRNVADVHSEVVQRWPDQAQLDAASTIVFIGDTFPPNRMEDPSQKLSQLASVMDRGCGIVCLHYATGLWGDDVTDDGDHPLLRWLGGYFANRTCPHHESIARIFDEAKITPSVVDHPITRGWTEFTIHDEPYINNYFGPGDNSLAPNVVPIAVSMLPPEKPREETVAWCVSRDDGGRGFAIVMPHFYKNWSNEDLRRCILNGIVWTAHRDVPTEGVLTDPPKLREFEPASVDFVPRRR